MFYEPHADHLEYLDDWFQALTTDFEGDQPPEVLRLAQFTILKGRAEATLLCGIPLPAEEFARNNNLSLVEQSILLLLLRDAVSPWGQAIANLPFLVQRLGRNSLSDQFEIRRLLEEQSCLRSLGLIECDQDPIPVQRLYRLTPRWAEVLLGKREDPFAHPEVPANELEAFSQLDLLVALLTAAAANPPQPGKCVWSGPAVRGAGWDALSRPRMDLLLFLRALSQSKHPFGRLVREAGLSPAEGIGLAAIICFYHRMDAGLPVPVFIDFMRAARPGGKDPAHFLEAGSRLSGLIRLEPESEPLAKRRVLVTEPVTGQLIPYSAKVFTPPAVAPEDELPIPLFERRQPRLTLEDVVLEPGASHQINRALRERESMQFLTSDWGFDGVAAGSMGTVLLFHGTPGTGKTLTAEAIAGGLGKQLSLLKTEGIISKYVGQSEKRLKVAFQDAAATGDVLLIDEADTMLGTRELDTRRHEVSLTNVLLQEIERFPGILILTTNRDEALDAALVRRLTAKVEFRVPGPVERKQLWRLYLPEKTPLASSVDLDALARDHELTGATIRMACLAAATTAYERDGTKAVVRQRDLEEAALSQTKKKSSASVVGFLGAHSERRHGLRSVQATASVQEEPEKVA